MVKWTIIHKKTPKAESVHLSVSRKEMSIFIFKLQCLIPLKEEITYILFVSFPPLHHIQTTQATFSVAQFPDDLRSLLYVNW